MSVAEGPMRHFRFRRRTSSLAERFRHTLHRWMLAVLDLDPVLRPASLIGFGPVAKSQAEPNRLSSLA
jgi:hypothetical protein